MKKFRDSKALLLAVALVAMLALALAGCGEKEEESGASDEAATEIPAKADLPTVEPGTLTIATDKPAYPPYFEDDDPSNGKGFESAVAYAVAERLGFTKDEVKWVVVPFDSSYAPGKKKFDFDINQISITDERKKAVSFSSPYYTAPQAVVAAEDSSIADAKSLADLKDAQLGGQVGTTSLTTINDVIKPSKKARVYNNSNDVVSAFKNGQIDGIVVDLPTAFYLTAAELENAKIVGSINSPGGDQWGLLLEKGSELTQYVSAAIDELEAKGTLREITDQYLGGGAGVSELK